MAMFDEFIVVDEKVMSEFSVGIYSFRDVTQFAALQFVINAQHFGVNELKIKDIGIDSMPNEEEPLAQIVHWKCDKNGAQHIVQTSTLNKGSEINYGNIANDFPSFVIRILKKREKNSDEQNAFPAPSSSSTDYDKLTVKIGDRCSPVNPNIAVSAHWLSSVSPVISRMLSVEMKEKQQRMITLDKLGVGMDQFMEFLEAINYLNGPFLPNPTNVLMMFKLADYFQVSALKSCCEKHLINCVEIPLIERFLLIDRYGLHNFKNYFLHLDVIKLRAFFNANHQQFLPFISKELLYALFVRAMAGL